jgi:hypothetical protein
MATFVEPAAQVEARGIGRIRRREAASCEAELSGLRPYCFLKALTPMHAGRSTRLLAFSQEIQCFDRLPKAS